MHCKEACALEHEQLAEWLEELKAYRSTGLAPQDFAAAGQMEHFHEWRDWHKAKVEGRLLVLPCKVGDTVWRVWNGEIEQYRVVSVWFNDQIKRRFHAECFPFLRFYDEDIGKRVFLTREEAEAALAAEEASQ